MENKQTPEHLGADVEDIGDLLKKIEKSYNIAFIKDELKDVRTFGELCDIIIGKIKLIDEDDCTRQQAFYKLRKAIVSVTGIDEAEVRLETNLVGLFPRENRRKKVKDLERELGFKLSILRPHAALFTSGIILFLLSLLTFFYKWEYAVAGIIVSCLYMFIIQKTRKELIRINVKELAEKITWEHYMASRRNPQTVNRKEIVKEIEKMFLKYLMTDLKKINRETVIVD
jgi:hypothetical protein